MKKPKDIPNPVADFVPEPSEVYWFAYLSDVGLSIESMRLPDGSPRLGYFANSNRRYCRDIWMRNNE